VVMVVSSASGRMAFTYTDPAWGAKPAMLAGKWRVGRWDDKMGREGQGTDEVGWRAGSIRLGSWLYRR
jgi:hypothetical protein